MYTSAEITASLPYMDEHELRRLAEAALAQADAWEPVDRNAADTSRAALQAKLKAAERELQELRGEAAHMRAALEQARQQRERLEREAKTREAAWQERLAKAVRAAAEPQDRVRKGRSHREDAADTADPAQEQAARVAEEQLAKLKASTKGAEGTGPWQVPATVRALTPTPCARAWSADGAAHFLSGLCTPGCGVGATAADRCGGRAAAG